MRNSLVLAAVVAAPLLVVVACGPTATKHEPLKGTVAEKEYKPAKKDAQRVPTSKRVCVTQKKKRTCSKVNSHTLQPTVLRDECYELDIKTDYSGQEIEVCNRAAYFALNVGDHYDSSVNYSKKARR